MAHADCELEKIDLSSCDRSGLGALQPQGIWNMDITFDDGGRTTGVMKYVGEPALSGLPISETRVEPDVFSVTSEVLEATTGVPMKYLFAGCSSSSPTQVQGRFRRCTNGALDLSGTFEARRVQRREGESQSDASGLELVSELALPRGEPVDLFVTGGYAYVSARDAGIYIYDISKPTAPRKVAELVPQDDAWNQVWVKDQTMYIASSKKGVLLYDVTNPAEPLALKSFPSDAPDVRSITGDGTWLYAAAPFPNAEVIIFDATNPRELVMAKRYFVEQTQPVLGDRPYEVLVRNGLLYVSHWSYGLAVSDVSTPKAPKLLGRFSYTDATTRTVDVGPIGNRTLAFEAGEGWGAHLRVLDVSSPTNITQVAEVPARPEVSVRGGKLVGTKLYVAHYQDGVRVLDVSNPNEPAQVGYFNTWKETDSGRGQAFFEGVTDVAVPGDGYIYATDTSRGLLILREKL
ncbi:MAG: LVIVD repeat-containing protein [Hyalangium sp.]|uniref:LVIVD repeat-containing protein n=1 Tax=Hyalangium sp. TaxID=2028555 RepID=UPI00389A50E8